MTICCRRPKWITKFMTKFHIYAVALRSKLLVHINANGNCCLFARVSAACDILYGFRGRWSRYAISSSRLVCGHSCCWSSDEETPTIQPSTCVILPRPHFVAPQDTPVQEVCFRSLSRQLTILGGPSNIVPLLRPPKFFWLIDWLLAVCLYTPGSLSLIPLNRHNVVMHQRRLHDMCLLAGCVTRNLVTRTVSQPRLTRCDQSNVIYVDTSLD